ncbi:MAG: VWA domain-containing protein [Clostridia bacterium]|nr:VWA domain-containing protein [Clostridia bacterium]
MSNISFNNPWLLLIALPLIAAVVVPFFAVVKKENINGHHIASVCLHVLLVVCVTLAVSGMTYEKVITDTQVYILADISYSAEHNLDDVQDSVEKVAKKLPRNSKVGVICFGRNYQLISDLGDSIPNVKAAEDRIDRSATDIGSAMRYAGNLFDDDVIKRIIVITDGVETVSANNIVKVVTALQDDNVYIDAVFIDDNISDDVRELQIDGVEATSSTYLNKDEEVSVLVHANCGLDENGEKRERTDGYVSLYKDGTRIERKPASFYNGLNVVNITLPTSEAGTFSYEVKVEPVDSANDYTTENNVGYFSQRVGSEFKVLFLGGTEADVAAGRMIYGTDGVNYISDPREVPLSVEEMYFYDEIVLCNFDVRTIRASNMFMTSLTTLVDDFGKTLTTYGDTFIEDDDASDANSPLKQLANLLPVRIGNFDQYQRLYAIVLDISMSMDYNDKALYAKRAAVELLNMFNSNDTVMVVGFSYILDEFMLPTQLTARQVVINKINAADTENGTSLSAALDYTYSKMPTRYQERNVIIITDALFTSATDSTASKTTVKAMCENDITVSALGIFPSDENSRTLEDIILKNGAQSDDAFYQRISDDSQLDVVLKGIESETQEVRIEEGKSYEVVLRRPDERVAQGVESVGGIRGFFYNAAKSQATVVLSAKYNRDKLNTFDVPVYVYWNSGGKGKVVSFLSDISSLWAQDWFKETNSKTFLSNIPAATLPDERITTPFIVSVDNNGNSTTVNVLTSNSLLDSTSFTATLTDPNGMITVKTLAFASSTYFASFATDAPGIYTVHLEYKLNDLVYETDAEFSIFYNSEYDSFANCSPSYLYRLLSSNGSILDLDELKTLNNSDSEYTSFVMSFTLPLMIVCAVIIVVDIVIRQLRWQDVVSFFSGTTNRRRK